MKEEEKEKFIKFIEDMYEVAHFHHILLEALPPHLLETIQADGSWLKEHANLLDEIKKRVQEDPLFRVGIKTMDILEDFAYIREYNLRAFEGKCV